MDRLPRSSSLVPQVSRHADCCRIRALWLIPCRFQNRLIGEQKAAVAQTTLVPFLEQYMSHPSNNALHPEDLERRANVLYEWWRALLEFFKSRLFASLASHARNQLFDAALALMERPEWRQSRIEAAAAAAAAAAADPQAGATKRNSDAGSESISSATNSEEAYVDVSAQQSIQLLFSECLRLQIGVVMDQLALRKTSNLVLFSGKTCAYAYFFCPLLAKPLVQLWRLDSDHVKRVWEEYGFSTTTRISGSLDQKAAALPVALKEVCVSNLSDALRFTRSPLCLPPGTQGLKWKGPWLDKWRASDTELFNVFVKQHSILFVDHLPDSTLAERFGLAGGVFIHAKMLANMEQAISRSVPKLPEFLGPGIGSAVPDWLSRQSPPEEVRRPSNVTFDDLLTDSDANMSMSFTPSAKANSDRSLTDNRMLSVLQEFLLSNDTALPKSTREAFGHSFIALLRATTKKIPQSNRFTADVLLDFLEETVVLLVRYEQTKGSAHFLGPSFWEFWIGVFKILANSGSVFIEAKVYSLIYMAWPAISLASSQKAQVCFSMLLEHDFFHKRFSHWCPMIRAYFLRLLCWRVARVNEEPSTVDIQILDLLNQRLREAYCYFLWFREKALADNRLPPSTAPAPPAPSKHLVLARSESSGSTLLSFDMPQPLMQAAQRRSMIIDKLCAPAGLDEANRPTSSRSFTSTSDSDRDLDDSPRRWAGGFFKTIIGTSKSRNRSSSPAAGAGKTTKADNNGYAIRLRSYCYKFNLEQYSMLGSLPEMMLKCPRLPHHALDLYRKHSKLLEDSTEMSMEASTSAPNADVTHSTRHVSARTGRSPGKMHPLEPSASNRRMGAYCGRALAEWELVTREAFQFFERRKAENNSADLRWVETPVLTGELIRNTR
jgi:hypothetical protein